MIQDKKKRIWYALGLLLLLGIIAVGSWKCIGGPLARFISDPAFFREWVEQRGWYSRLVYVGMVIIQVILAFIPGLRLWGGGRHPAVHRRHRHRQRHHLLACAAVWSAAGTAVFQPGENRFR